MPSVWPTSRYPSTASPTVRMETVCTPGAIGTTYGGWLELGPVVRAGSTARAGLAATMIAAPARAQARSMPRAPVG